MTPVVWMCAGQGAQYYGMGEDLYRSEPVFRRAMDVCDEILEPWLGLALSDVIYADRADRHAPFDRLMHSNPAIVALQYGVAQVLRARGGEPDLVLGYSLGEITAAVLTGALALEDGLRLAVGMAEILERSAPPGAMLAVLGDVTLMETHPGRFAGTALAGRNFDGHFVVSGPPDAVARAEKSLAAEDINAQRLPVRFAFHSSAIERVGADLRTLFDQIPTTPAAVGMMSASDGRIGWTFGGARLWATMRGAVDFRGTLAALAAQGPRRYVDLGPAGTLATFAKYGLPLEAGAEIVTTVTPFGDAAERMAVV